MNALRWFLIIATLLLGLGWAGLLVFASQFRQSFGASPAGPLAALAPVAIAMLLLIALRTGASRTLLHVVAAVVIAVVLFVVWSAEGKMDPSLYLLFIYLGLWLAYYGWSVWGGSPAV